MPPLGFQCDAFKFLAAVIHPAPRSSNSPHSQTCYLAHFGLSSTQPSGLMRERSALLEDPRNLTLRFESGQWCHPLPCTSYSWLLPDLCFGSGQWELPSTAPFLPPSPLDGWTGNFRTPQLYGHGPAKAPTTARIHQAWPLIQRTGGGDNHWPPEF